MVDEDSIAQEEGYQTSNYTCGACQLTFITDTEIREHVKTVHSNRPSFCSFCNVVFDCVGAKKRHYFKQHRPKAYPCPTCEVSCKSQSLLEIHLRTHGGQQFTCKICNKVFRSQQGFKMHTDSHEGSNLVSCPHCRNLLHKSYLFRHINMVHGENLEIVCEKCNKIFKTQAIYKIHLRTHEPNYRCDSQRDCYECAECGKKYKWANGLRQHQKRHSNDNLVCELCGKLLLTADGMKIHMRIHRGEKPFECDVCGTSFAQRNTLNVHKLVHTGEKPHTCAICGKKFSQRTSLKSHIRAIHTKSRPYKCSICEKGFVNKSGVNAHMKCHGERLG